MEVRELKSYIYENNKLQTILEELEMHHIKYHNNDSYITCGMPDGDNPQSTTVYNNFSLNVIAYTRDIKDPYGCSDIISLICFIKKMYFSEAINWVCNLLGLDYYYEKKEEDPATTFTANILKLLKSKSEIETLKKIDESILHEYINTTNIMFYNDNINFATQRLFEIGLDIQSNRITIPIRDELGNLVGVKGRWFGEVTDDIQKYLYLHQCPKSQILYGLDKTIEYIKEQKEVIVVEAEKAVMQLYTYGFKNAVAIGGHSLSPKQIEMLIRLNVDVIIACDKDIKEKEVLKECKKLSKHCGRIDYIIDRNNILSDKESPSDDPYKWMELYMNKSIYID